MKESLLALIIILAAGVVSCRQQDIRTIEIRIPEMKNQVCMELVVKKLSGVPGVRRDTIVIDMDKRIASVKYDSLKLAKKNIEFAIAESGFAANDVPANEAAAKKLAPEYLVDK